MNKNQFIIFSMLILSQLIYALVFFNKTNVNEKSSKEIKRLEKSLDSLSQKYQVLEVKSQNLWAGILSLENKDRVLEDSLKNNNDKIKKIRKQYEDLNRFDYYNTDSLLRYFSNEFEQ